MDSKFFNWYTQSLGGTFGIISCICAYLNGYMFVYTNSASSYFESIGFLGIISSYVLLPLCMITLVFGIIRSYTPDTSDKSIFDIPFFTLNKRLILVTVVFGFIGARFYFIIPAILMTFNLYSSILITKLKDILYKNKENDTNMKESEV
ncbi:MULTISPECIES: hypothetical protein [unclassified Clostridioides]|uniref:hypothetical protein n=1 Tax=unclassified Clostridioides TaxID=2635829 RepID=UPI001D0FAFA5|nr:hypothetical protein [Clostridioides sp. ZZV14-6150]MCC0721914.1 hypothetical protein [Clostridioides sp. ZZV14-6104]MCC0727580.1 hypothetical protein [Clostridioides sp. ZZV14-6045]MCC0730184.1 hypothetical protein [Clostridioides sp. ZZV14-6048]MCC0734567.1 hypothetical protein [Clostridioides sp. ZZV14-6009]MCC0738667.1 hypothetical protein [Clostridioides sp. ZZV14-5902]MCC0741590.1 hypothetical protein [Clostridioides sp. ZZV14-6044]MCC0751718.1 hypothetical protein [Clostridioides s